MNVSLRNINFQKSNADFFTVQTILPSWHKHLARVFFALVAKSFVLNAPPQSFDGFQIILRDVNSSVYPIYFFQNKGIQISNYRNIPLLDATTNEYKWVEKYKTQN